MSHESHKTTAFLDSHQGVQEIHGLGKVKSPVNILASTSLLSPVFFSLDPGPLDSQGLLLKAFLVTL